ncbi:uncharacterized protein LOC111071217 [Drosophila obscura]|uniref:uncharacterized protein LOC111071217 n=1 Tax=Drosophila obscura TaxID=7282 RepID=UPI001BB127C6|nr:uncharacterized protein LOC111071217 [Drosophila obscura]
MTGEKTYSKRVPGGDEEDEEGGEEASESAESLERLTIPELLERWAKKKSERQGAEILQLLELRTKAAEQSDAERALRQQENLRAQEQALLRDEKLKQRKQEEEAKAAKRLAALRSDFEHQILVQKESEAKRLREEAEKDTKSELQKKWKRVEEKAQREREQEQRTLNELRRLNKEKEEVNRQQVQVARQLEQQRERFVQHQRLHTGAQHLYPQETSTTFPTASSHSSLMQNEMVNLPMANLKPILKPAPASASGGGVRYFSQFSKGGLSAGTTLVHQQQQQRKPTANGDLHANGRLTVVQNGMRVKTEQQDMLMDNCTFAVTKPEAITKKDTQPAEADTQSAEAAPVTDAPLALISNQQQLQEQIAETDDPELDIVINNVVCTFSVRCHLKLRDIALRGCNVEYRRENGMVTMKLRRPYTTASIWSSGRITCTGATSEIMAKVAARRYARCLGKLGFPTRFQNFRVVNVLGTCSMPWAIKIVNFSTKHRQNASYEPELHPGVTYKMRMPKATLKIFSTGSITVTAASVNDVESAIQHIYPLVHEFRKQRSPEELQHLRAKQNKNAGITGTTSTITDASEARALEEQILAQSKTQSRSDILVNATAAHAKTIPGNAAGDLVNAAVCNVQRLKQIESYRQMSSQTQEERRHIPFPRDKSEAGLFPHSASGESSTDNICANARRRATECWVSKLQNKRTRYNDPSIAVAGKATTTSSSSSSNPAIQSTSSTSATSITGPIVPLSSLTPIGSISGSVSSIGSRPFGLMAARTIPATGTIINIKQSCIKPLNRDALAAFTAASSGSIATAVNSTATANAANPSTAAIKRQSRGGGVN